MSEWWEDLAVMPTRYDLGRLPGDPINTRWRVILDRGRRGWAITDAVHDLNKSGKWSLSSSYDGSDEWIAQHRWQDPQEAIVFYRVWLREFMEKELKEV